MLNRSIRRSWWSFGWTLGVGVVLLAAGEIGFAVWSHSRILPDSVTAHSVVALMIASLLAAAGLMHHYSEKMAYREHAKLFRRMRDLFGRALKHLNQARGEQEQQELLRDLGIFALEENGDWVTLHRERPLEVPFG